MTVTEPRVKPRLRGVQHEVAFYLSPLLSLLLWLRAHGAGARLAVAVYAVAMSGLFGVSALFHRRHWNPVTRLRLRRLDHSMIFLAIAGSYTAIAGLTLSGWTGVVILSVVWVGALAGIAVAVRFVRRRPAPKWAAALPFIGLGWVAMAVLPELLHQLGAVGFALTVVGGVFYTAGAVIYGRQSPDPLPTVFGYHEVFHSLVLAGAAAHYVVIAFFVLP